MVSGLIGASIQHVAWLVREENKTEIDPAIILNHNMVDRRVQETKWISDNATNILVLVSSNVNQYDNEISYDKWLAHILIRILRFH